MSGTIAGQEMLAWAGRLQPGILPVELIQRPGVAESLILIDSVWQSAEAEVRTVQDITGTRADAELQGEYYRAMIGLSRTVVEPLGKVYTDVAVLGVRYEIDLEPAGTYRLTTFWRLLPAAAAPGFPS
jgi:hypothetical protein